MIGLHPLRKIHNYWIRCNVQYFLVGILIGTFINIIFSIGAKNGRDWEGVLITYIISIIITLCITNISIITSRIIKKKYASPFINILINYGIFAVGIIAGSELSYLFIMLIYKVPFSEINQFESLKLNLTLGFIAGTIIYIYHLQADNYQLKIDEKEVQLLKLNELKTHAELKTLQARINPHFLYNALNSITSLIHDEPDKAEEMTLKLSQLFRYSINKQESWWASVKEETELAQMYFDIEKVRFGDRISFILDIAPELMTMEIPRFLLQPLIENALKHGLKDVTENGKLELSIQPAKGSIEIMVKDNGADFPADMSVGYGLQSSVEKLDLLYGDQYTLKYQNKPFKAIIIILPNR